MIGLAIFFATAGTSVATAQWSATSGAVTGSASAGSLTFTQTGTDALAKSYSPSALVDFAPITVTNTGTVPSPFSLRIAGATGNNLTNAIAASGWLVSSTTACTATPPNGAVVLSVSSLTTGFTYTGASVAPGASAYYCVKTTLPSSQATTVGDPATVNVTLTATVGNWQSTSTASAVQKVVDSTAPSVPGSLAVSSVYGSQVTLSWAASTDDVLVTGYDVLRNGTVVASVTGTSFTDTGLSPNTKYSYTVKARDAAGNRSAASTAVSTTTTAIMANAWYTLASANSGGLCVDGDANNPSDGAVVAMWGCNSTNYQKQWQFVPTDGGYVWVKARYAPTLGWDVSGASTAARAKIQLWTYVGGTNQQWLPQFQSNGFYHFVNRNSGLCLDVTDGSADGGTRLQQWTCGYPNVNEDFRLTAVG